MLKRAASAKISFGQLAIALAASSVLLAIVNGCVPKGIDFRTPLASIETDHTPDELKAELCTVRGELYIPKGGALTCGAATAAPGGDGGTPPQTQLPSSPLPAEHPPEPEARSPEVPGDPLEESIIENEGGQNTAYCDESGLHIGDGFRFQLSDAERAEHRCERIEEAKAAAERALGPETWRTLDQVRRDVYSEVCYWTGPTGCHSFTWTIKHIRTGNWNAAADELLNTTCPTCLYTVDPERTEVLARWMRRGVRD